MHAKKTARKRRRSCELLCELFPRNSNHVEILLLRSETVQHRILGAAGCVVRRATRASIVCASFLSDAARAGGVGGRFGFYRLGFLQPYVEL